MWIMPKPKRGKTVRTMKNWRGDCPVCGKKRVKILWEKTVGDGKKMVCKACGG
jgi:hypothetical protein